MNKKGILLFLAVLWIISRDSSFAQIIKADHDFMFIHHSCGQNLLDGGLRAVLIEKDFIDEVNDIYYGDTLSPDPGRPPSLGDVPGDSTNMNHWILWFNDYYEGIRRFDAEDGLNSIIMFKSCYPISNIYENGSLPGDPFDDYQTFVNYQSVFRKYGDSNGFYTYEGNAYRPLEQIFRDHPETLFVVCTSPPLHYSPYDATSDEEAARARRFANWLKNEWLPAYNIANPGMNNVAVFDWFDILAYPDDHPLHPNRLRQEYGGDGGDSHPNGIANHETAQSYSAFIDAAYQQWQSGASGLPTPTPTPSPTWTPTLTPTPTPLDIEPGMLIFQQGVLPNKDYTGAADVVITDLWANETQLGGLTELSTYRDDQERHRILIRFDLESISSDPIIENAYLSLYHLGSEGDNLAQNITLHRMTSAWMEGSGDNPFPLEGYVPDGATWNQAAPGIPWTTPGGDFDLEPIGEALIPPLENAAWLTIEITDYVKECVENHAPNYGIMIRTVDGEWFGRRFASSDYETAELRPRLLISMAEEEPVNIPDWTLY